jgi:hypothetical protein
MRSKKVRQSNLLKLSDMKVLLKVRVKILKCGRQSTIDSLSKLSFFANF